MKIEYLKEFYMLAELLNYTQAAEKLYISQPALSRHVQAVEEELGYPLLKRTTKSVELTEAGEILHQSLPAMIVNYDNMLDRVRRLHSPRKNKIYLGLPQVPANDYLKNVPAIFATNHPEVELIYHFGNPEENIRMLLDGELDVILISHIPFSQSSLLEFTDFGVEPFIVFLHTASALAKKDAVLLQDLRNCRFILIESNYFRVLWERFAMQCEWAGFTPQIADTVKDLDTALAMVRQGYGCVLSGGQHHPFAGNNISYVRIEEAGLTKVQAFAQKASAHNDLADELIETFLNNSHYEYTGK